MKSKIGWVARAIGGIAVMAALVTAVPMRASAVTCNSVVAIDLGDPTPSPRTTCVTDTECAVLPSAICCTPDHIAVGDCAATSTGICVHPFALPGDIVHVTLHMGASASVGATTMTVNRIRLDLDCDADQALGLPCADQGTVIEYEGDSTITTNCVTSWSTLGGNAPTTHPLVNPMTACASDAACSAFQFSSCCTAALAGSGGCDAANIGFCVGNELVFSANPSFSMPIPLTGSTDVCQLSFDVKVFMPEPASGSAADTTPTRIEEVGGFRPASSGLGPASDAFCPQNDLPTTTAQTAQIPACPVCEDNNACTTDTCNTVTGACVNTPITCNDNNACTTDTCNPATGCVSTPIAPCNDNNACTTDTCNPAVGCVTTPIAACNDNNACTTDTCDPATGCTSTPIAACNDNNACTTDTCDPATGCTSTPIAACNDNNACTTDTCDPATGCVSTPIAACDDNNACTNDTCDPATGCVSTPIAACNDNNACTSDTCNPATGCVSTAITCDDNNACTSDTCNPATGCVSTPITCNDNNACTSDTCNPATGCVSTPIAPCDDNNACTSDTCNPATGCVSTPIAPCDDNNACTSDTCNPATGCVSTPIAPCNDNNACTSDTCNPATGCVSTPITCNDNNACTADTCNPASGCVSTPITCNDNNACTSDTCNPATGCTATPIAPCNDNNACTTDTCNPATGCTSTPVAPCNDNNACTSDTCNPATGCVSTAINCNDNNACTSDTCNPAIGCVSTPITCNDNNACTSDTCNPATGCTSTPITCNDNNACTSDTCDPATGCTSTPITCNDNNACTNDTCDPTTGCVAPPIPPCDDNNTCTNDTCNPATGCVSTDNGSCANPCPPNPLVGAAGTLRVLALGGNTFSMSGPKTFVGGDVGIGATASGKFDAGTVTGNIIVDPNGTLEKVNVPNAGVITQDLTQAVQDALNAAAAAAAASPTRTFASDVVESVTLVGNGGTNVVNFNNKLTLSSDTLTLQGGPNDVFILNVFGQFKFDGGSKVVLQGGVLPQNVLFNIVGPGEAVKISGGLGDDGIPKTQLIGTVLAPQRTISFTGSMITGALIGGMDIHMDSGSRLVCPPGSGTTTTTLTTTSTTSTTIVGVAPCVLAYPFASSNPRTSVVFNEMEVLRAFGPAVAGPGGTVRAFYNDEHALLLGVSGSGFPVSPFTPAPGDVAGFVLAPQTGDPSATNPSGRPISPSLFITDITAAPGVICTPADTVTPSRCHDWQFGGTPVSPSAVFGTWKAATRSGTSIMTGDDPAKNNWDLDGVGPCTSPSATCPDPVPAGLTNQGYGAEVRWNVNDLGLTAGHVYRMQFMVHDGDQNKTGGDVGQGCATVSITSAQ